MIDALIFGGAVPARLRRRFSSNRHRAAEDFGPRPRRAETSLAWILEPLESDPGCHRRRMFGCDAAYLNDKLYLVVADKSEPWNGLLVCTSQEHHAALRTDLPALRQHPILGKWLYLSQTHPQFEHTARLLTALALERHPRLGVQSKTRRRPRKELPKP